MRAGAGRPRAQIELWCGAGAGYELLCAGKWMLAQSMWKWHEQEFQCYRVLMVQRCSDILQWWWDHIFEFRTLSDLVRNTFCVMATNAVSERVFSTAKHVVNSRRANLKSSSGKDVLFLTYSCQRTPLQHQVCTSLLKFLRSMIG